MKKALFILRIAPLIIKVYFAMFETWVESVFCNPNDSNVSPSGGGRKNGMTDAERNAEGDGDIPTFRSLFN